MDLLAVFTTVATKAQAETMAHAAVQAHLAACVQMDLITSTYRWQGTVETSDEVRLLFKTTRERQPALVKWIAANHPHELPAIYAVPVAYTTQPYANWVRDAVDPARGAAAGGTRPLDLP